MNFTVARKCIRRIPGALPMYVYLLGWRAQIDEQIKTWQRIQRRKRRTIADFPRHLHLGCGPLRADGFCNVDISDFPSVDIRDDVSQLSRFPENYAESIYACHVLEHFSHAEAPIVLKNWYRVLSPGGEIRISVPDIDRIVKVYTKNWNHFQTEGNSPWIGLIYGGQLDQYDFHKSGYNFCWLSHIMRKLGYIDIKEYPHEPHFIPGFKDASLVEAPFGEFLSLNIYARKPNASA